MHLKCRTIHTDHKQFNTEVDLEIEKCDADQSFSGICATTSSENSLSIEKSIVKEMIDIPSPTKNPKTFMIPSENHVIKTKL